MEHEYMYHTVGRAEWVGCILRNVLKPFPIYRLRGVRHSKSVTFETALVENVEWCLVVNPYLQSDASGPDYFTGSIARYVR